MPLARVRQRDGRAAEVGRVLTGDERQVGEIHKTKGGLMITKKSGQLPSVLAAALIFFQAMSEAVAASSDFDGNWSVKVIAEYGECRERTIFLQVHEGTVSFAGFGATATGAVGSDGRLQAQLAHREEVVKAKGALRGTIGNGIWSSLNCAGSWIARRG